MRKAPPPQVVVPPARPRALNARVPFFTPDLRTDPYPQWRRPIAYDIPREYVVYALSLVLFNLYVSLRARATTTYTHGLSWCPFPGLVHWRDEPVFGGWWALAYPQRSASAWRSASRFQ